MVETCYDFNLYDAFRMIDRDAKGHVSAYELREAFSHPSVLDLPATTMDDIELILARYDKD